jgi:hypothetical protein
MTPWPPRQQAYTSNEITSRTTSSHIDTNRPLPPLPSTAADVDAPTLYPRHRTEPEAAPIKHGRSFSHPFPSLFRGGSKRSERRNLKNKINVDSTDEDESIGDERSNRSSHAPSRNPSVNASSETMMGKCMTCDSTVRWPRELKVFRCTICLTVNDLEPNQETSQEPTRSYQNNTQSPFAVQRKRM